MLTYTAVNFAISTDESDKSKWVSYAEIPEHSAQLPRVHSLSATARSCYAMHVMVTVPVYWDFIWPPSYIGHVPCCVVIKVYSLQASAYSVSLAERA